MHVPCIFILFSLQPTNAQIDIINIFSLYNVHFYMFRQICVILTKFQYLYFAKLSKFLKL